MSVRVSGTAQFTYMDELLPQPGRDSRPAESACDPTPGTATLRDLIRFQKKDGRIYELVDRNPGGQTHGIRRIHIARSVSTALQNFLANNDLGMAAGEQGLMKLMPGLARGRTSPLSAGTNSLVAICRAPDPGCFSDLAVEVLSKGNTAPRDGPQAQRVLPCRHAARVAGQPAEADRGRVHRPGHIHHARPNPIRSMAAEVLPGFSLAGPIPVRKPASATRKRKPRG